MKRTPQGRHGSRNVGLLCIDEFELFGHDQQNIFNSDVCGQSDVTNLVVLDYVVRAKEQGLSALLYRRSKRTYIPLCHIPWRNSLAPELPTVSEVEGPRLYKIQLPKTNTEGA